MFWKKEKPKTAPSYTTLLAQMQANREHDYVEHYAPDIHPSVAPIEARVAMDGFCSEMQGYVGMQPQFDSWFLGYQHLAIMAQSSSYRAVAETNAEEMTRKWGRIKGGDPKKMLEIEAEMERLGVRDLFRKHIENDHLYGGSQLFIRIKGQEDKKSLPLLLTKQGIKKGDLEGFTVIEPMWTMPAEYNSIDPLAPDFYQPTKWWVMGNTVHSDRLLTLIMRPVPDMLKPAYNFRGVSMSQLMRPFVERFQRTVDSISKSVENYSLTGIKVDMSNILSGADGGSNQLMARLKIFAHNRNNNGLMVTDVSSQEEFFQFNTPLSTLDALLSIFHEMIATPAKIPLVKLLGLTPSGLNANSDGEIRVYYDHISAMQEAHLLPQLNVILKLVQLNLYGKVDEDIFFKFDSLYQLNEVEQAAANLTKAQTDQIYMQEGVLDNDEVREIMNEDEDGAYTGKLEGKAPELDEYAEKEVVVEE